MNELKQNQLVEETAADSIPAASTNDTPESSQNQDVSGVSPNACADECAYDAATVKRFWAKVDRGNPRACWLWTAGCCTAGYGHFRLGSTVTGDRRKELSHRLAYELAYGPISDGLQVLHGCDNPPCCNPAHLFLGTHAENMRDRGAKGRQRKQESANQKLRRMRDEQLSADESWRLP